MGTGTVPAGHRPPRSGRHSTAHSPPHAHQRTLGESKGQSCHPKGKPPQNGTGWWQSPCPDAVGTVLTQLAGQPGPSHWAGAVPCGGVTRPPILAQAALVAAHPIETLWACWGETKRQSIRNPSQVCAKGKAEPPATCPKTGGHGMRILNSLNLKPNPKAPFFPQPSAKLSNGVQEEACGWR